MALDPNDLLDPPYGFGECSEIGRFPTVSCECFKNGDTTTQVIARKHGDWVNVNISDVFEDVKEDKDIDFATIKIAPFLPDDFLGGDKARKRFFGGLARVFELETEVLRVVPAMITMDKDGTITIYPSIKVVNVDDDLFQTVKTSNFFFSSTSTRGIIGSYNINFSYVVSDNHEFDDDIKFTNLERSTN